MKATNNANGDDYFQSIDFFKKYSLEKYSLEKYSLEKYTLEKYTLEKYSLEKYNLENYRFVIVMVMFTQLYSFFGIQTRFDRLGFKCE